MHRFAPYESAPHLAIACSGGADSLALTLLAHRWAQQQGGQITAIICDHGLRKESAAEAAATAETLLSHNVDTVILPLRVPQGTRLQERARDVRYAALTGWCRDHAVLHLLTGHQRQDQAETFQMRAARGSGPDGLAGIPALSERAGLRLLRPLLGENKTTLQEWLQAQQVAWIEDSSNSSDAYERNRLRQTGDMKDALAETAMLAASHRAALEQLTACWLANYATLTRYSTAFLRECPAEDAYFMERGLKALLATLSGTSKPLRVEKLQQALQAMRAGAERLTLQGCIIERKPNGWHIYREWQRCETMEIPAGQFHLRWDGRFRLRGQTTQPLTLKALSPDGVMQLRQAGQELPATSLRAAYSLPSLWHLETLQAVPHIGYVVQNQPLQVQNPVCDPVKTLAGPVFYSMTEGQ